MPTRIRKSAIYSFVEAFVRTHRKGRVKRRDVRAAIDFIDAKLQTPTQHLQLPAKRQGVLQNMVLMLLNAMTAYDQKAQIVAARRLLEDLTDEDLNPVSVTATGNVYSYTTGWVNAVASSTLGTIVSYAWRQSGGDGGEATLETPNAALSNVTLPGFGMYVFEVTATDSNGFTATDTVQIQSVGE